MVLQGEEIEAELARERQLKHLKQGTKESLSVPDLMSLSSPSPSMEIYTNGERAGRKVDEILAEQAGVSPSTFSRGKYIIKHGSEDMKKELREGHLHIDPAYKKLGAMGDPTATEVEENTNPIQVEEQANDFEMDVAIDTLIRLTYSAAPNLVDLVIPSWAFTNDRIDDIILASHTAALAGICLKPGKCLAIYVSANMLARILTLVQGQQPGLECVYCLAVESCKSGSSKREQAEGVVDFVLVFKKRTVTEESEPSIASLIRSNGRGGANDRESGVVLAAEFLINHLTKEGDRVCDTVCGTPTLRRIASRLKREFIGTDREMNRLTASVDSLSAST